MRLRPVVGCAVVALVLGTVVVTPSHAAPRDAAGIRAEAEPFLERLLAEINLRRARAGTVPLASLGERANGALEWYLADLTPAMEAAGDCFHGEPPGWDYVARIGVAGDPAGEVIACPGPDGYWTPERIAEAWWASPGHQHVLYRNADARAIACGVRGPQRGGSAYRAIACVTYRS